MSQALVEEVKGMVLDQAAAINKSVEEINTTYKTIDGTVKALQDQMETQKSVSEATKNEFQKHVETVDALEETLGAMVEKLTALPGNAPQGKTLGQFCAESELAKTYKGGSIEICEFNGPLFSKANESLGDDAGAGGNLIEPDRTGVVGAADEMFVIRSLLSAATTASNAIEWVRETFTNNAGSQTAENTAHPQSILTYAKVNTPVETVGHAIYASRQILSDYGQFQSRVDTKLRYGLAQETETQIIAGDGTNGNLNGLVTQATAYDVAGLATSGDGFIDQLRRSALQIRLSNFPASAFVLNPEDWCTIELSKDDQSRYIFANPSNSTTPRLWGRRVAESTVISQGDFLTGSFMLGATLYDRQQVTVRLAEQHADFFMKGMVAILGEQRLALAVEHPLAFVEGTLAVTA